MGINKIKFEMKTGFAAAAALCATAANALMYNEADAYL